MSPKTFASAPKPTADAIAAYERRGLGHDTQPHKPTKVGTSGPTKRLSIDMPPTLHRRFKIACTKHDLSMVREVIDFIERRTAELEGK